MTKQTEIRYRFLDVWLEPSENPEGHLSWNSGDIVFYLHGADCVSTQGTMTGDF